MIRLEEYNPDWPKWFDQLHSEIWPVAQEFALSLEHVGSTSVPGLAAKPIIDLDLIIESLEKLPSTIKALSKIGYAHRGNLGIEGREAFHSPDHKTAHHLYVCISGCAALRNHLALRDHLRSSPSARDEYANLKRKLAREFSDSIDNYVEGKTEFILSILSRYPISETELALIKQANRAPSHG